MSEERYERTRLDRIRLSVWYEELTELMFTTVIIIGPGWIAYGITTEWAWLGYGVAIGFGLFIAIFCLTWWRDAGGLGSLFYD